MSELVKQARRVGERKSKALVGDRPLELKKSLEFFTNSDNVFLHDWVVRNKGFLEDLYHTLLITLIYTWMIRAISYT